MEKADLVDLFENRDPISVFVPNNRAMSLIDMDSLLSLEISKLQSKICTTIWHLALLAKGILAELIKHLSFILRFRAASRSKWDLLQHGNSQWPIFDQ